LACSTLSVARVDRSGPRSKPRGYEPVAAAVPAANLNHPCLQAARLTLQNIANRNERSG
jgi:hypothetical protein